MSGENSTARKVLDALVGTGLITTEQLANASESAAAEGVAVGPLLVARGLVSSDDIVSVLESEMGVPRVDLSSYTPEDHALSLVPMSIARESRLLPLFDIEGILTVAIGDAVDVFALDDLGTQIGVEMEPVLTDPSELLAAVVQYYGDAETKGDVPAKAEGEAPETPPEAIVGDSPPPAPVAEAEMPHTFEETAPTEPAEDVFGESVLESAAPLGPKETIEAVAVSERAEGGATIDLDVLAVADPKKVGVLVADILDAAVQAGASHIQVLPYKHDFFLVFRVKGRLEKIASAPLSMQAALVDGLKRFARLSEVPSSLPALGRVRAQFGELDIAVTVSAVPTVAGQRVVMTLRPNDQVPKDLEDLGMSEAEKKALYAMVDRGRGMLLICGPVAGGRSMTFYSLLARAAEAGKTVYSVERSIAYELPAVAQVMVTPGSSVQPSAYIAAGLRQDTDAVAVDALESVEDVHLAVEAAGRGRLVIATFAAGDIMSGVRRLLDLGVEPQSLAAALTVAVGQRLVRTNCPHCTEDARSDLNARIPGLDPGAITKRGVGCPNCQKSGYGGVTGIFEVLPFSEAVRGPVARDASLEELEAAAIGAGMRALVRSGLAKVQAGIVSVDEVVRVLRLDG